MRERSSIKSITLSVLLLSLSLIRGVTGQEKRVQAWKNPGEVTGILWMISDDIEPTLPAPRFVPEPPFTWGIHNTVFWYGDSVRTRLDELGLNLLFYEVKANFDQTELWGFVRGSIDSATFTDLPTGIPIEFRLRYFAQDFSGQYFMSYWSEPTWSIQDNSPPVLHLVEILNLQDSGDMQWAIGSTIQLRIQASDPQGQVMEIAIHEQSESIDDTLFHSIEPPTDSIDITIPYTMRSPEHIVATLHVWVIDVSGQETDRVAMTLFWWQDEGKDMKMYCFPNPFNPVNDEITTIRIDNPSVMEARIFDHFGNLIRVLFKQSSADLFVEWDGKNGRGQHVSTGGYICVAKERPQLYCKIAVLR